VDAAGNGNSASNLISIVADIISPSVIISTTVPSINKISPIPITITFNEPVIGFNQDEIILTNGTLSNFESVSTTAYRVQVTPIQNGQIQISVPSNVTFDQAFNFNLSSNILELTFDNQSPTVVLESLSGERAAFPTFIRITFSEPITQFSAGGITVENGDIIELLPESNSVYSAAILPKSTGNLKVFVAEAVCTDEAGNLNEASNQLELTIADRPALVVNKFITPTSDDNVNNTLYIENIEYYSSNKVTLVDRLGTPVKVWNNFTNQSFSGNSTLNFDFSELRVGYYICIIEYVNPLDSKLKTESHLITLLK
jgi:hypothetical protein